MRIYLAARYERREELAGYARELEADGHTVTSRWLDGSHGRSYEDIDVLKRARAAIEDVEDILSAEAFVAFTGSGGRGGRHVETGYALALGIPVYLVGEPENVFHFLLSVLHFGDWPTCRLALKSQLAEVDA